MKRHLHLERESLAELTVDQLGVVVGGTHAGCAATDGCTHGGSLDQACPTTPVRVCLSMAMDPCI